jgi:hypothetical protein
MTSKGKHGSGLSKRVPVKQTWLLEVSILCDSNRGVLFALAW